MRPIAELEKPHPPVPEVRQDESAQAKFYPESLVGGFTNLDGTILFYAQVHSLLKADSVVVDFGCGRGCYVSDPVAFRRGIRIFNDKVAAVIGLDVDPEAHLNPTLSEFRKLDSGAWPLEDKSVDLVLCDCVVEHVPDPAALFDEASRVLRKGGHICIRTTNQWHYVGVAARLIPERFHHKLLRKAQPERETQDIFPAVYRCNTIWKLRKYLGEAGFDKPVVYTHEPEPRYLAFGEWAYALGVLYERLAPGPFRSTIFAFGQKAL